MSQFKYFIAAIFGGIIVWGLSTHTVGDGAVNVCDFIHKYSHNFIFELAIILIVAILIYGLFMMWVYALPVFIGIIALCILSAVFIPDGLNKGEVHISHNQDKERVWGG